MAIKKDKILIVDDLPENLMMLMNILKEDYSVIAATNGAKAIELATLDPKPDIILLDIMMPDMDGYEVCRYLQKDIQTRDIPIIFITAKTEADDEAKGLDLGAVDYIGKPVVPAIVRARVRNHLELKRHRNHLEELVAQRTYQLKKAQESVIEAMGMVAEHRDPETGSHISRTKAYVNLISLELAKLPKYKKVLTPRIIELVTNAAPLHDLGKIAISDSILLKEGPLTPEEWEIMKTHPLIGEETINMAEQKFKDNDTLLIAKDIAGAHHEKWNGTGYPRGLKGENIPLWGRIMAVADVYDAIISHRSYKKAMSHKSAISYLLEKKGTQFDPEIIDAFMVVAEGILETAIKYAENNEQRMILLSE
ncbi:HD-GYP domain-containing protein [Sulfuricurvum sp.]|uniref:HD-GYP domain-containing protein n=1 Tax=Sulfuricurvum sp. TaxID=2025608 RepID=UPI002D3C2A51|nr:HD domain-containing phosphohydrolase [Sulfuricurvum sp.]HZF70425.1 HD domain-containing phosphohydrolase [Sulfuricurvum sp.]